MAEPKFIPSPAFKAFLEQEAGRAKKALGISGYIIKFKFVSKVPAYKHIPAKDGYTFEIEIDYVYMEAEISISQLAQKKFDEGKLASLSADIVHECVHILTGPLYDFAFEKATPKEERNVIDLSENLTQKIANLISL